MKIYQKFIVFLFVLNANIAFSQQLKIIEKPIIFDSTRTKLSLDYLKKRHNIIQQTPTIIPTMIVLHWTASKTMMGTHNAFNKSILPSSRKAIALLKE